jgi:hypothetical protein
VFLPVTFLCIPLYMRFLAFQPHFFNISPLDMKLLNQVTSQNVTLYVTHKWRQVYVHFYLQKVSLRNFWTTNYHINNIFTNTWPHCSASFKFSFWNVLFQHAHAVALFWTNHYNLYIRKVLNVYPLAAFKFSFRNVLFQHVDTFRVHKPFSALGSDDLDLLIE